MKLNTPLGFSLYAISLFAVVTAYMFLTDAPAKIGFWMTLCSAFVGASSTTAVLYYVFFIKPKRLAEKRQQVAACGAPGDGDRSLK